MVWSNTFVSSLFGVEGQADNKVKGDNNHQSINAPTQKKKKKTKKHDKGKKHSDAPPSVEVNDVTSFDCRDRSISVSSSAEEVFVRIKAPDEQSNNGLYFHTFTSLAVFSCYSSLICTLSGPSYFSIGERIG